MQKYFILSTNSNQLNLKGESQNLYALSSSDRKHTCFKDLLDEVCGSESVQYENDLSCWYLPTTGYIQITFYQSLQTGLSPTLCYAKSRIDKARVRGEQTKIINDVLICTVEKVPLFTILTLQ